MVLKCIPNGPENIQKNTKWSPPNPHLRRQQNPPARGQNNNRSRNKIKKFYMFIYEKGTKNIARELKKYLKNKFLHRNHDFLHPKHEN